MNKKIVLDEFELGVIVLYPEVLVFRVQLYGNPESLRRVWFPRPLTELEMKQIAEKVKNKDNKFLAAKKVAEKIFGLELKIQSIGR